MRREAPHGLGSLCMGTALLTTRCFMGKLQTLYHPPERPCTPKGMPCEVPPGFPVRSGHLLTPGSSPKVTDSAFVVRGRSGPQESKLIDHTGKASQLKLGLAG